MLFNIKCFRNLIFPSKHLKHQKHVKPSTNSWKLLFPSKHSQKLIELFFPNSETVTNKPADLKPVGESKMTISISYMQQIGYVISNN